MTLPLVGIDVSKKTVGNIVALIAVAGIGYGLAQIDGTRMSRLTALERSNIRQDSTLAKVAESVRILVDISERRLCNLERRAGEPLGEGCR